MPKFRILTPAGASFTVAGGGYGYEMEALEGLDAEIVECPATEEGFIAAAKGVDAVYAKGMKFTRPMIDGAGQVPPSSRSAPSASTTSMSPPRPRRASPSPTARTPSSRKSPTTR